MEIFTTLHLTNISGAVVAREYGLPCIVAAHGATKLFHSGEKVLLDGNKGFLQTVDEDEEKKD